MNIVKQSLYLCIGVLMLLIALQGTQSLWQVSRLSSATESIADSSALSAESQALWTAFVETDELFRTASSFVDSDNAALNLARFDTRTAELSALAERMQALAHSELKGAVKDIAKGVTEWSVLAATHLGDKEVTELPSPHLLDEARDRLRSQIADLVRTSSAQAALTVSESRDTASSALIWTIFELLIALAIGLALGWFALSSLRKQLGGEASEVARVAHALAQGDLATELQHTQIPAGSVMAALVTTQGNLRRIVGAIAHTADGVVGAASEVAAASGRIADSSRTQNDSVTATAAAVEQLVEAINRVSEHAAGAGDRARHANGLASSGREVVDKSVQDMREIAASVNESSALIDALHEKSSNIGAIVGVIQEVAARTNLLALNAAIEAARAGDQGRGFAVVADEVRKLAERTTTATAEIVGMVSQIREGTSHAVSTMTASEQGVVVGVGNSDAVAQALERISAGVRETLENVASITEASAQQRQSSALVSTSVEQITRMTEQNTAAAQQVESSASSLNEMARELQQHIAAFRLPAARSTYVARV